MKWQSIAPVESKGACPGIIKYSSGQQGYSGNSGDQSQSQSGDNRKPSKAPNNDVDKFCSSNVQKTTEFQSLMLKMLEGNEKMKKTANHFDLSAHGAGNPAVSRLFMFNTGFVPNRN